MAELLPITFKGTAPGNRGFGDVQPRTGTFPTFDRTMEAGTRLPPKLQLNDEYMPIKEEIPLNET